KPVALMRGHGNLVVASDIPRVVHRALYTEINAKQLATALSFGRPIKYIAEDEMLDPQRLGDSWDVWKTEATGGSRRRYSIVSARKPIRRRFISLPRALPPAWRRSRSRRGAQAIGRTVLLRCG